jgi:hypothetical protein
MKKQNQPVLVWQKVFDHDKTIWWVALLFAASTIFAWSFFYAYGVSTWLNLSSYFHNGAEVSLAVVDNKQPEMVAANDGRLLDGVIVDSSKTKLWPYAVMVENLLSVRPQSGLSQASVVYEALAEGGSTRFMAVFDPLANIPEIMPVRSSRPYYLEWVSEYGALYAHAGGSPKALTVIRENPDINNLEALSGDAGYFWRDKTKSAPHNLVTSSDKMFLALNNKGLWDKQAGFRSWLFKDDAALDKRGDDGKTASFNFSTGKTYKVDFRYNKEKNVYLRFNADQPHLDKNSGQQIEVKNVIVQIVQEPELDGGKGRLDIYVGGEGQAWIFRDGQVINGVWKKGSRTDRTLFYDSQGQEVELSRGNTWIHVVPKDQSVTYQ